MRFKQHFEIGMAESVGDIVSCIQQFAIGFRSIGIHCKYRHGNNEFKKTQMHSMCESKFGIIFNKILFSGTFFLVLKKHALLQNQAHFSFNCNRSNYSPWY